MKFYRAVLAGLAVLTVVSVAWAANNFPIATSGGNRTTFKSTDNAGIHTPHVNVDTITTITTAQGPAATTMATAAPTAAAFGTLLASSVTRKACLIQNTGTTLGYVYFGANGSATTGNSFQLSSGQSISCANGTVTANDNVAGTCASGTCAFVIASQ